jgi:sugar phosphate isomerase/epimerase
MSLSPLPPSYCTNVHAGRTVAEVEAGLERYTVAVRDRFGGPLAAGLWLARPVADELAATHDALPRFADGLRRRGLTCHTLNAFPYGDFHSERVKENVYLPDWSQPARRDYTLRCAGLLAGLLPDDVTEGSISTLPLGFKGFPHHPGFVDACVDNLLTVARSLSDLRNRTGKTVRLAIEPEPLCVLETTDETVSFFARLFDKASGAGVGDAARAHLGMCYDVCHQAVEFEDAAACVAAIDRAGIRINKVHVSCALQLDRPAENREGREALRHYVEPRYLHQTTARDRAGVVHRHVDLSESFIDAPPPPFGDADAWRVHFHVPVDAERIGPLATTRPELRMALAAVAKLDYAPHLEVETYTWEVMPGRQGVELAEALAREMIAAREMIGAASRHDGS